MIYWFTGQPSSGKTTQAHKLYKFLQTQKRNWRKSVFHLDGDDLRKLTQNKDYSDQGRQNNIRTAQTITEYLPLLILYPFLIPVPSGFFKSSKIPYFLAYFL